MSTKKLVVSTYLQYILIALGALLLLTFIRQIGGVLLTFLLATILAYALNPLVRRLEAWRIPRVIAVLGVFMALMVAVLTALLVLIIPAVGQVQEALMQNPTVLTDGATRLLSWAQEELPYVGDQVATIDQAAIIGFAQSDAPSAGQMLNAALSFVGGVFGVFGTMLNLVLVLIVSVYMLLDRERIMSAILQAVPVTVRDQTVELFYAVESTLVKYLKAQLLLCAIMGVIGWAIAYFTFGSYALLIGLWVGFTEIIPVLGPFLGAIPAVLIALFSGGFIQAILVASLFLVAQQLEGNVLQPKIMGGSAEVHPLRVLFATLAGTSLYGAVGAIFAVPLVAIVAAALRYLRETLLFERWPKAPIFVADVSEESPAAVFTKDSAALRSLTGEKG
ncbi:MAG TPA: AI-2E family transporter [Rubrobacteraceae bacterium]|nr:AI-2E family transporter [Rubrobacteraceae bacterium]